MVKNGEYTLMTSRGKQSILRRMKNVVAAYGVCKYLRKKGTVHVCKSGDCPLFARVSAPYEVLYENVKRKNKIKDNKEINKKDRQNINEFVLITDLYADKYFSFGSCTKGKDWCIYLTNDGTKLTDSLILPYTPKNLWLAIWKENKIIVTGLYSVIASLLGIGTTAIIVFSIKTIKYLWGLI